MFKKISLLLTLLTSILLLNTPVLAKNYAYQGNVKGMVCAFCAYNVSHKIGQIAGVNSTSVNVDLKSGKVGFWSILPVEKAQIATLFVDSGFSLISLEQVAQSKIKTINFSEEPMVTLKFSNTDIETLDSLLDAIGTMASEKTSRLTVKAPKISEIALLKPILAGRQRVTKVQFLSSQGTAIELKLYQTTSHEPR